MKNNNLKTYVDYNKFISIHLSIYKFPNFFKGFNKPFVPILVTTLNESISNPPKKGAISGASSPNNKEPIDKPFKKTLTGKSLLWR